MKHEVKIIPFYISQPRGMSYVAETLQVRWAIGVYEERVSTESLIAQMLDEGWVIASSGGPAGNGFVIMTRQTE